MTRIPVLFCCDAEPEDRNTARHASADWPGVEELAAWCQAKRPALEKATGRPAHFNWFIRFDPQVEMAYGSATWAVDRYRATWDQLRAEGDELGVHVHMYRWDDGATRWTVDHGDPAWVRHCVQSSVDAYRTSFRAEPRSYRAGDRFLSNDTVALLEEVGFRYEVSGEPGQAPACVCAEGDHTTGMLPDYRRMPRAMYRPSRRDFLAPGRWLRRKIWMVPLSSGCVVGEVMRGVDDEPGPVSSLNLILAPEHFRHMMEGLLQGMPRPYLGMVLRSGDWEKKRSHIEANLAYVLEHPRLRDFAFVRPDEAVALHSPI
jgi:hypothetical protein